MPRQAQETTGAPFAKLVNLGDTLIGAWGGAQRKQQRDYESGDPKWKDQPGPDLERVPLLEEVNWFVAMPGTTAKTGTADDGYGDVAEGDVVRFSFAGFKWHNVIEARKGLPALGNYGVRKGREASSDVYTITLAGWSKETKNPEGAVKAGFTVEAGRIVLRTEEEADRAISMLRKQGGNINLAKDIDITVRRADMDSEKQWADMADELWDSAPWKAEPVSGPDTEHAAAGSSAYDDDEAPF
jgi:hypothetical protein